METLKESPNSSLCLPLLELVSLRVAELNDCKHCVALHYKELKSLGDTDVRLSLLSIWNEVPYFSNKEKALLALTDDLAGQNSDELSDEVYQLLHHHFSDKELSSLTLAIKKIDSWTLVMKNIYPTIGSVDKEN